MAEEFKSEGQCFCGNCKFQLKGKPFFNVYCHCTLCQRHNGAPFSLEIGLPLSALEVVSGSEDMKTFESTKSVLRRGCSKCCGLLYSTGNSPMMGDFVSVPAGILSRNEDGELIHAKLHPPKSHIFYANRMFDVKDDLPKFVEFPGGETVQE